MKKILIIFILSFVQTLYSQQSNIYHIVSAGETLSTVAQKYKITPYDIVKLNPNAVNGIKEKEVLIIPKSVVVSSNVVQEPNKTEPSKNVAQEKNQKTLLHIVQSKETKYGIAKLYGVSIQELEAENPHIVAGLQSGHKLKISGATTNYRQDLSKTTSVAFDSKIDYIVQPGETLYGISKRNGLTVDELTKANEALLNGVLKSGQKLIIPTRKGVLPSSNSSNSVVSKETTSSKYHLVEPKETKFGLSKKYGVTIEQLENLNPHIVKGLQIGQKILIPSSYNGTDEVVVKKEEITKKIEEVKTEIKPNKVNSNQEYVDYEIQPKETLFGLSKKAGLTVGEMTELNPKLATAVQIGMKIKMPKNSIITPTVIVNNDAQPKNVAVVVSQPAKNTTKYQDLTKTIDKTTKKQLSIVLPFDASKFNDYSGKNGFKEVQDEFLKSNLEFYSGALKAIDSAKILGLDIDVKISELPNNAEDDAVQKVVKTISENKSNAVLMSFYDAKIEQLASGLETYKIPVIANHLSNQEKHPSNLYLAVPSDSAIRNDVLDYLKQNDANIIVVNSSVRQQSKKTIQDILPNSKFVKVSERDVVDTEDIKGVLVKDKLNYVILDTDLSSMIISSTNVLLKASTDYHIQIVVLEPSMLNNYQNISSIRINILKMMFPSYSSVEQLSRRVDNQSANYFLGFDLTFDTLLRISQQKDFETTAKESVTEQLKYKFQYSKNSIENNINRGFYILQHETDATIKQLK